MEQDKRFEIFYNEILKENERLEELRNVAMNSNHTHKVAVSFGVLIIMCILFSLPMVATLTGRINGTMLIAWIISLAIAITIVVMILKSKKNNTNEIKDVYTNEYKEKVIKPLIKIFDNIVEYDISRGIEQREYDAAEFYQYDRYKSQDYIKGNLQDGDKFSMSSVWSAKIDNRGCYSYIFNGLFAKMEMTESVNSDLYLKEDRRSKYRALVEKNLFKAPKVEIDSKEFESYFDVYSTDEQVAVKIFNQEMIEFMINLRKKLDNICELTLKNNCMYIRMASDNIFEAPLKQAALDKNVLYRYYKTIDNCIKMMEMVKKLI